MSDTPDPKQPINWPQIEADYRAGIKSLREIAEENGISHPAIRKRAKRDDWTRDLNPKIHAKADMIVHRAVVSAAGSHDGSQAGSRGSQIGLGTERAIVAGNANVIAGVRLRHRAYVNRALKLTEIMFGDLECLSSPEGAGLIESLVDSLGTPQGDETPEQRARRRQQQQATLNRALGLDTRVDTGKKLSDMLINLINAERLAFGITDKTVEAEETAGRVLNDAERISRLRVIMESAMKRRAAEQLAETPAITDAP